MEGRKTGECLNTSEEFRISGTKLVSMGLENRNPESSMKSGKTSKVGRSSSAL